MTYNIGNMTLTCEACGEKYFAYTQCEPPYPVYSPYGYVVGHEVRFHAGHLCADIETVWEREFTV